jgi:hypothetical protein
LVISPTSYIIKKKSRCDLSKITMLKYVQRSQHILMNATDHYITDCRNTATKSFNDFIISFSTAQYLFSLYYINYFFQYPIRSDKPIG